MITWIKTYRNALVSLVLSSMAFSSFIRYPACVWAGTEIPDMSHYTQITNLPPNHWGDFFRFSTEDNYICEIDGWPSITCMGDPLPGANRYYNQIKLSPMFAASISHQDWSTNIDGKDVLKVAHHEPVERYPLFPPNSMYVDSAPKNSKNNNPLTCGYSGHHSLTCYEYYNLDVKGDFLPIWTLIGFTISSQGTHIFEYPTPDLSVAGSTDRI